MHTGLQYLRERMYVCVCVEWVFLPMSVCVIVSSCVCRVGMSAHVCVCVSRGCLFAFLFLVMNVCTSVCPFVVYGFETT